jgi:TetR/AcrR family transcriptional regulator
MVDQNKETAIVQAARDRFAHYGYSKVTMEEIASDVELGKASLYYYFPTKEDLFKAVISLEQAELLSDIEKLLQKPASSSDKLREYVKFRMQFFRDLINLGTLSVHSYMDNKSVFKKLFVDFEKTELELINQIIDEGIRNNEFLKFRDEDTPVVFLHILQGLRCRILRNARGRELDKKTRDSLQQEMQTATEIFLKGIQCKQ